MEFSIFPALAIMVVAGVGFAVVARYYGRSVAGFALLGAVGALVVSTICLGLAHATTLPYTARVESARLVLATFVSLLFVGLSAITLFYSLARDRSRRNPK